MHNMIVEYKRGSNMTVQRQAELEEVTAAAASNNVESNLTFTHATVARSEIPLMEKGTMSKLIKCIADVTSESLYHDLRHDLVEHIWNEHHGGT